MSNYHLKDGRYTIGLEFCGDEKQKHVLRFCGDWLSKHDSREQAEAAADYHALERPAGNTATGWRLLRRCGFVLWLQNGRGKHRIAYGADVREFRKADDLEAGHAFGECVRHEIECEG